MRERERERESVCVCEREREARVHACKVHPLPHMHPVYDTQNGTLHAFEILPSPPSTTCVCVCVRVHERVRD